MKQSVRNLASLMQRIGYQFKDFTLLELALSHRSKSSQNNERLEFLGDAILSAVISHALYNNHPGAQEGELTRMRSQLVKGTTLQALAKELNLGAYLSLGLGELKSGGHQRPSILSDAFEALVGAMYLDSNLAAVTGFLQRCFGSRLSQAQDFDALKDPKTRLQELLQKQGLALPVYELQAQQGEAHESEFLVACYCILAQTPTHAQARSRRQAEQEAAQLMLQSLNPHVL